MTDYERGVEQASAIYKEVIREYVAENAKLREERDRWHVEQVHAYGNWEDAHKRATELELENAKLREVVNDSRWHLMADEQPRDSIATYVIMGKYGAVYLALGFDNSQVFRECFLIPNNRRGLIEFDKVKAWLKVPVYGEV